MWRTSRVPETAEYGSREPRAPSVVLARQGHHRLTMHLVDSFPETETAVEKKYSSFATAAGREGLAECLKFRSDVIIIETPFGAT